MLDWLKFRINDHQPILGKPMTLIVHKSYRFFIG
jgi:hypothetical protein